MAGMLRYLNRKQLDTAKWDSCIDTAPNGLVYAYSWYLDIMARNWDALVWGDYEAVMPLTWNRKYGQAYLYQPAFTASLGVFGTGLTPEITRNFLEAIPFNRFKLAEIELNAANLNVGPSHYQIVRTNYVLSLNQPYAILQGRYRESTIRNIRKAARQQLQYQSRVPLSAIIELARVYGPATGPSAWDYEKFTRLFALLEPEGRAISIGVYRKQEELLAACAILFSHSRAYYLLVGNHPNGRTLGASHYLIDQFIQSHAGKELLLDFEGSDASSLAFFYSSFGAEAEQYPSLRINRLPAWVRLARRLLKH